MGVDTSRERGVAPRTMAASKATFEQLLDLCLLQIRSRLQENKPVPTEIEPVFSSRSRAKRRLEKRAQRQRTEIRRRKREGAARKAVRHSCDGVTYRNIEALPEMPTFGWETGLPG
jgi:hypothetical protein